MMERSDTPSATAQERLFWMDGLRGFAALQVVLLHYASAFLPAAAIPGATPARYGWDRAIVGTPLFFLWNGYASVFLFFLLSGAALTFAFARAPLDLMRWCLGRVMRLGVPMAAAIVFGAALFFLWPDAHEAAAADTGSEAWLGVANAGHLGLLRLLHQVGFEGMALGYADTTILPTRLVRGLRLDSLANSFDPPLWTLHVEFIGSLLVLGLVMLRAVAWHWLHAAGCGVLLALLVTSPLVLFVIGHLMAPLLRRSGFGGRWRTAVGGICLLAGIVLCSGKDVGAVAAVFQRMPQHQPGRPMDLFSFQNMLGALLIFMGIVMLPRLKDVLNKRIWQSIGRISFSLYLTHYPVLFTLISLVFVVMHHTLPYSLCVFVCIAVGLPVSFAVAALFERWIDRPANPTWPSGRPGDAERVKMIDRSNGGASR